MRRFLVTLLAGLALTMGTAAKQACAVSFISYDAQIQNRANTPITFTFNNATGVLSAVDQLVVWNPILGFATGLQNAKLTVSGTATPGTGFVGGSNFSQDFLALTFKVVGDGGLYNGVVLETGTIHTASHDTFDLDALMQGGKFSQLRMDTTWLDNALTLSSALPVPTFVDFDGVNAITNHSTAWSAAAGTYVAPTGFTGTLGIDSLVKTFSIPQIQINTHAAAVPEPSSVTMLIGFGISSTLFVIRRKRA